jgi:predicted CXXCH cytochrome family protein
MRRLLIISIAVLLCLSASGIAQVVKVNEPEVCLNCHSEIGDLNAKKHVHTAFKAGKCSSCHNPHAARHAKLLADAPGALCLNCHSDIKKAVSGPSPHQPAAGGDCLTCHDPHASDNPGQLKQPMTTLCTSCHPAVNDWLKRPNLHQPVAAKQCLKCHSPHGTGNAGLLVNTVPQLCFGCHQQDQMFQTVHKGYNLSKADCTTCHDPHSSGSKGLLMANQHPPFKGGRCTVCHGEGAQTGGSFAIQGSIKTLCTKCHADINTSAKLEFHPHVDSDSSCVNCHNPHASNGASLLASDQKNLCLKCHFNNPQHKDKSYYITHDGKDCTTCHKPHGADNARLFAKADLDLCRGCHPDVHKGSHPMAPDPKAIDPRTKGPVTCISCHKLHGADFKPYLPLSPDGDLCVQCHRK